jgi:hypothetical protein
MQYGDHPGAPPSYLDQPGYGQLGSMPPTYEAWGVPAVICGLLFNAVLGFPAAFWGRRHSDSVSPLWANGDVHAAVMASRKARGWLIASGVLDVLGLILTIVIFTYTSSPSYNNPSSVAASIKAQVQQRLSDPSGPYYAPGLTVTSVVCTPSGTNTDHCVIRLSTGDVTTKTATISGNGTSYSTN